DDVVPGAGVDRVEAAHPVDRDVPRTGEDEIVPRRSGEDELSALAHALPALSMELLRGYRVGRSRADGRHVHGVRRGHGDADRGAVVAGLDDVGLAGRPRDRVAVAAVRLADPPLVGERDRL